MIKWNGLTRISPSSYGFLRRNPSFNSKKVNHNVNISRHVHYFREECSMDRLDWSVLNTHCINGFRHVPSPPHLHVVWGSREVWVPGEREVEVREGPLRRHDIDRREVEPCAASYFPLIRKTPPISTHERAHISTGSLILQNRYKSIQKQELIEGHIRLLVNTWS